MRRPSLAVFVLALAMAVGATGAAIVSGPAGAQSVPPPTPVPPFGSPSPYPTALVTPEPSTRPPELAAAAAALVDLDSGQVLYQRRGGERRPIASTTKIMTALLVLEAVRPDQVVTASPNAAAQGGAELGLEPGERIPVRELLFALMLQSANDAAVALAEHVAGSVDGFVERMNERVRQLGLRDTDFASPNGLDDRGYSTAEDLAAITVEAYRNDTFDEVVRAKFHQVPAPKGPPRSLQSRNALLWLYPEAIGVKTGYTSAAGFCLVGAAERDDLRLVAVVLGEPREAFSDTAALLNYGFETFERRDVVLEGERFDPLEVGGQGVEVAADHALELLLRRGEDLERRVVPEGGLSLPLAQGERVGSVVVDDAEGRRLGEVPLVSVEAVRRLPSEEPAEESPWWERIIRAVGEFFAGLFRAVFG